MTRPATVAMTMGRWPLAERQRYGGWNMSG